MAAPNDPPKRVLVVEDDPGIALGLQINLQNERYEVHLADDGEKALRMARELAPDLMILDLMLPKVNGFEVLQTLRKEGHTLPIIVLSARSGEMDKVSGLELGAEDYVAKPFSLAELLARVRGAIRRHSARAAPRQVVAVPPPRLALRIGEAEVDLDARLLTVAGAPVEMTATEFDVLACLSRARGRALSREKIFQEVWGPNHHGTPRTIDNFIQQIRAKLEPDPQVPRYVMTVRGVGYRLADQEPPNGNHSSS
jgi:DNA-binding response OmpR family regulator